MIVYIVMYNRIQQVRKGTKPNSRLSLTVESRAVVGRVSSNSGAADQWWAVLESSISDVHRVCWDNSAVDTTSELEYIQVGSFSLTSSYWSYTLLLCTPVYPYFSVLLLCSEVTQTVYEILL